MEDDAPVEVEAEDDSAVEAETEDDADFNFCVEEQTSSKASASK